MAEDLMRVADAGYCCIYETHGRRIIHKVGTAGNGKVSCLSSRFSRGGAQCNHKLKLELELELELELKLTLHRFR